MANSIKLKSINDLLGMNFFIPSYQRGYRWTEQQVKDLLDDIWEFTDKTNKQQGEFYCLQPIVVKSCDEDTIKANNLTSDVDSNKWYEVIDGQQRLTTIFLLIHYFNEMWVGKKKTSELRLRYETRKKTSEFLDKIQIDNNEVKSSEPNDSFIDYYFISNAYRTINSWVEEKDPNGDFDNNKLQSVFKKDTQVIWYELSPEDDSIESFTRLNVGKIPLTNAELIKALFLQKRNFDVNVAELRQIEIAKEWDTMKYALQKSDFWAFLNETDSNLPARIEFLFDVMYQVAKNGYKNADKKYGTDQYATFRYFNEKFHPTDGDFAKAIEESWNEIKDYFGAFEGWFKDNEWYHYIGYLIWSGTSIVEIYSEYNGSSKTEFKNKLVELICNQIGKIEYSYNSGNFNVNISYDTDKKTLRSLLLLYNIEFILQKKEYDYYRFPFDLFKSEEWDIEHISSQTTNELKDKKAQEEWLRVALDAMDKEDREEFESSDISVHDDFNAKRKWITEKVGEEGINEGLKNCIGNLTLLNATINRSYGNAIFPAKRKEIIKHDKNGSFIPLCTKNVFLKYLTGGNNLRWNESDIKQTMNHFVEILKSYLKEKKYE